MRRIVPICVVAIVALSCKDKPDAPAKTEPSPSASATSSAPTSSVTAKVHGQDLGTRKVDAATLGYDKGAKTYIVRLLFDCPSLTNSCEEQQYSDSHNLKEYTRFQKQCPNVRELRINLSNLDMKDAPLAAGKYDYNSKPIKPFVTLSGPDPAKDYGSFYLDHASESIELTTATETLVVGKLSNVKWLEGPAEVSATFTATSCKP